MAARTNHPDRAAEQREIHDLHALGQHYLGDWYTHPRAAKFDRLVGCVGRSWGFVALSSAGSASSGSHRSMSIVGALAGLIPRPMAARGVDAAVKGWDMTTDEAAADFLDFCERERSLSPNTLAAYRQDAREFLCWFGGRSLAEVDGTGLVGYAAHLSGPRRLAPATVKRRLACLRSMFRWLVRRSFLEVDPFTTVEIRTRIPDRLPRCISAADMDRLSHTAGRAGGAAGLATLLLLVTGARVGELSCVRLQDVDLQSGTIRIRGKGDRERRVFFPEGRVSDLLTRHLALHRGRRAPGTALFVDDMDQPITPATIRRQVRSISATAELTANVTPHVLRHTAATSLLEAGTDIRFVQRLLGHRSIVTTQMYTHVSNNALKAAVKSAGVCARLPR